MAHQAKLIFLCGKMAAGKSTLARQLAEREGAILMVQDELLEHLYPQEIVDIPGFVEYSGRLERALTPHLRALLNRGVSVVLDFPGNTKRQRAWFRQLITMTRVDHELHFVDTSDEGCKRQLRERSKDLPEGAVWTTDAEFDALAAYFEAPTDDEGFKVVRHSRN